MAHRVVFLVFLALCFSFALASDPTQMQDFCVANLSSPVTVNGLACKDSKLVVADDFYLTGFNIPGNVSNRLGFYATPAFPNQLPGLNTLGLSMARIDYAPNGIGEPHYHPRGSEMVTVLEGTLEVGFIASNPDGRLFTKVLNAGDIFVFPMGLIHYQKNIGKGHASAIAAFSAQNPGVDYIADLIFGSTPRIPADILSKTLQIDASVIKYLEKIF